MTSQQNRQHVSCQKRACIPPNGFGLSAKSYSASAPSCLCARQARATYSTCAPKRLVPAWVNPRTYPSAPQKQGAVRRSQTWSKWRWFCWLFATVLMAVVCCFAGTIRCISTLCANGKHAEHAYAHAHHVADPVGIPDHTAGSARLVKELSINHADFVDEQRVCVVPAIADLKDEGFRVRVTPGAFVMQAAQHSARSRPRLCMLSQHVHDFPRKLHMGC